MKSMNNAEMMNVNGGKEYVHCTVCCSVGAKGTYTFKNNALGNAAFYAHTLSSAHKKNVKAVGYGHNCCWFATH